MLPGGLKRTPPSLPSVVNHSLFRPQNVYCNSIGCPNGYTPIDDAAEVKCDGNDCRAAQCCEAFCSYHACPDNYTPVDGADSILCDNDGCTTSLCCNNGESRFTGADLSVGMHGLFREDAQSSIPLYLLLARFSNALR